jgi:hypothetical protein
MRSSRSTGSATRCIPSSTFRVKPRACFDDGKPEGEVAAFVSRWRSQPRSGRKSVQFAMTYRSYVFNYSLGEDIVREWIGTGPDRRSGSTTLDRPVVPSELVRH